MHGRRQREKQPRRMEMARGPAVHVGRGQVPQERPKAPPDRAKVSRFGPELVPLVTSGPPGVTGFAGGRPKAAEIIGFWPTLVTKDKIQTKVSVLTA